MTPPKVLLVELNHYHDEVLPSFTLAFQSLGYHVDLLTTGKNLAKDAFARVASRPDGVKKRGRIDQIAQKFGMEKVLSKPYDLVVFNSVEPLALLPIARRYHHRVWSVVHNGILVRANPEYQRAFDGGQMSFFALAPFVAQKYLGDERKTLYPYHLSDRREVPANGRSFAIQGGFNSTRRNYESLLEALKKFKREGIKDLRVEITGRSNSLDQPFFLQECEQAGVLDYLDVAKGELPYKDYYRRLEGSRFLLPLLEPGISCLRPYYDYSASSSISMAVALGMIPVIDESLADLYRLGPASVLYRPDQGLYHAMSRALELSDAECAELTGKMDQIRSAGLVQNVENLRAAGA